MYVSIEFLLCKPAAHVISLPEDSGCVVHAGNNGALLHIETLVIIIFLEDAALQINIRIGDIAPRVVKGHQVSKHVRR